MKTNPKSNPLESFTLLAGLAQEINAPLQSLLLSSQKLLDTYQRKDFEYISYKDFQRMLTMLERMNQQIKRCYQTSERLTGLGKSKGGGGSCHIHEVISYILGLLEQQCLARGIKVQTRFQKNLPKVRISPIDGYQVIHNILTNAMQAMPAGGMIKIRTSLDQGARLVAIEITDQGVGITPGHLSKIFEPFFTTKERGVEKNSGLGLSIVYALIQAVGGAINIQSSLRKGTLVRILLPAVRT